jgi:hypothetical protein
MLIFDVECYKNFFHVSFMNAAGKVAAVEMRDKAKLDVAKLAKIMRSDTLLGFNNKAYDEIMIAAALQNRSCAELKALSDQIIQSNLPSWRIAQDEDIRAPRDWDTIDIIEVLPGQASLKIYGARIGCAKLQDLPYEPSATLTPAQMNEVGAYCVNDLRVTKALADKIAPQLALRVEMGAQYGVDLRSKSDAQIAEVVLKSEIEAQSKTTLRPLKIADDATVRYADPGIVGFTDQVITNIFKRICAHDFELSGNGSVRMPKWLSDTKIKIGDAAYQMGIGGLHSTEKAQGVRAGKDHMLFELDVASYYPSIILQQGLEPKNMTGHFLPVYQSIVTRRLEAKRTGDKVTADTLKIVVNGSFGKLGSKYSNLYAPDLMIQTTITGQLCLLMLIERLTAIGAKVVSANTDGVVIFAPKAMNGDIEQVAFDWQMDTSYELERTDYSALYSRDVNTYIAVKPDGSTKTKGALGTPALSKNPDFGIVAEAVAAQVSGKGDYREVIRACEDITKFVSVRKVTGGAMWAGQSIGKSVRFYYSNAVDQDHSILYKINGNKVPKSDGARPLMDLPDVFPADVEKERYVGMAMKVLAGIGYDS